MTALFPPALISEELPTDYFVRPLLCKDAELSPDAEKIAYLCNFKNVQDGMWGVFSQSLVDKDAKSGWRVGEYEDVDTFSWVNNDYVGFNFWSNALGGQALSIGLFGNKYATAKGVYDKPVSLLKTAQNQPYFYGISEYTEEDGTKKKGIVKFLETDFQEAIYGVAEPDNVLNGIGDLAGVIRLVQVTESGQTKWIYRTNEQAEWETLAINGFAKILGFSGDTNQILVVDGHNKPTQGVYLFDPEEDEFVGDVYWNKSFDLNDCSLITDGPTGMVLGLNYDGYFPKTQWFNADMVEVQKVLNQNIPGNINRVIGVNLEKKVYFVESLSDKHPTNYYALDLANGKLEQVLVCSPWLDASKMASSNVVQYKNREGTKLFGYFTKTTKETKGKAPTIVICHGENWSRIKWGWDSLVQFLAYHGYNVLKLNTRGCAGMGWQISGDNQNFLNIAEDMEDAVAYLASKGIIDGSQVGIMGNNQAAIVAAYEAYKNPDMFKCAIAANGIYDLEKFIDSDRNGSESMKNILIQLKGAKYKTYAKTLSPVNNEIKIPMHISYGCHQCAGNDEDASSLIRRAKKSDVEVDVFEKGSWRGKLWDGEFGEEYYDSLLEFLEDVMPAD